MKIKGLLLADIHAITQTAGANWVTFVSKVSISDTVHEGFFKTSGVSPLKAKKNDGTPHYGPCHHFYGEFIKQAKIAHPGQAFTVWLHKHALTNYTYHPSWKAETALKKKGYVCAHGEQESAHPLTTLAGEVAPAPKPKAPSGTPFTCELLAGDPISAGETTSIKAIKGKTRPIYAVVTSLYALEECKIAAQRIPPRVTPNVPDHLQMRALHAVAWRVKVLRLADQFAERLARNFFDFCTVACFGEARYGQEGKYTFDVAGMKNGRSEAYQIALAYDPRDLLPKLMHCFNDHSWGGSYGGKKWGNIAKAASLYFKFKSTPIAFVDHCVDLSHNGGLAFNKGYIIGNPSDQHAYMKMLDEKRVGSIFASTLSHPVTTEVYALVAEGVNLGMLKTPKTPLTIVEDVQVPALTWGADIVTLYDGNKAITPTPTPSSGATTEGPTYEQYPIR